MDFGAAVKAMKENKAVRRAGWNGKNMHVFLESIPHYAPCMVLLNAQGALQPGWNASTPDVLADDWEIVPG